MKKILIFILLSTFLFSQSLTKGWYNDDFEVPGALITETFEVLGGTPAIGKVLTDDGTGAGVAIWSAPAGGGANTALSNLAAVAINTSLILGASDGGALGSITKQWSDLFLASGGVINWDNGDLTLTHSANLLTLGGGDLQLGANNLGMTGSLGLTGARLTKGWFTDLEVTNAIAGSITGNAATVSTIAGLAPNTATTAAAQPNITSLGTQSSFLATVGGFGIARTDGTLHIHTATAGAVASTAPADELVIENLDHSGLTILSPDNKASLIYFGSPGDAVGAIFSYGHAIATMALGTATAGGIMAFQTADNVLALTLDASQNAEFVGLVGIGKSPTAGSALDINLATEDLEIIDAGSAGATEQDWLEVEINGVQGYIRVFAAK